MSAADPEPLTWSIVVLMALGYLVVGLLMLYVLKRWVFSETKQRRNHEADCDCGLCGPNQ